ncbi:MAG TPA: hypothetical protein VIS57_10350, partial [Xanthomonadales bacterium]
KLDPLHAGYKATLAGILYYAGNDHAAIQKAREALQLDPEHFLAVNFLVLAYTDTNDTAALASLLDSISPAMQELAEIKSNVARGYAVMGDQAKARKIYDDLVASSDSLTPMALLNTAGLAITLGEINEGVALLERLEKSGSWIQFWSKLMHLKYSAIRDDPRYQSLLKRMGLDDASVEALNKEMSF